MHRVVDAARWRDISSGLIVAATETTFEGNGGGSGDMVAVSSMKNNFKDS
jgi:hypothetical protein